LLAARRDGELGAGLTELYAQRHVELAVFLRAIRYLGLGRRGRQLG
jgi:hypothetical protein